MKATTFVDGVPQALEEAEAFLIRAAMERTNGTLAQMSPLLGISRHALKRRLIKYDIEWSAARSWAIPRFQRGGGK